jgi:alkanesulfonate monooxygenase SsuD/methylene tetrahydromethanopterin reductase-like flavin-dependent oxidoreductase (luciferase family)
LRLTAQYADYWDISRNTVDDFASVRRAVDQACAKAGRDPATLQRTAHALVDLPGSENSEIPAAVRSHRASRAPATGTSEQLAEGLRAFAREGVSHVQLWLEPNTMAGIDDFAPMLELLDRG